MTAARRLTWNFALQHAVNHAQDLGKPLIVLEALRCGYPWASDRLHAFVMHGMADHAARAPNLPISYYPYVEPEIGAGRGFLAELAGRACAVVTDDYPAFFYPRMLRAAARIPARLEAVDSNGILPMRAADRVFPTAYAFRRFLQSELPRHLAEPPRADPLDGLRLPQLSALPPPLTARWPVADIDGLAKPEKTLRKLPGPAPQRQGSRPSSIFTWTTMLTGAMCWPRRGRVACRRTSTSVTCPRIKSSHGF
jgi:deoxyribodipyrimidine photo-lyase